MRLNPHVIQAFYITSEVQIRARTALLRVQADLTYEGMNFRFCEFTSTGVSSAPKMQAHQQQELWPLI